MTSQGGRPSRWSDLDRPPLSQARLQAQLGSGPVWREIRVLDETASTNADAATAASEGIAEGLVVIAEHQTGGRGRLDRQWESPPRAGLLLSVLLRPGPPAQRWTLLPLLAGLAVCDALRGPGEVTADLKWPNDVLIDSRKVAGLLAERAGDAVVLGLGLNVSTREAELPLPTATSVALQGGHADREILCKAVLRSLARRYVAWTESGGDPATVLSDYRRACETIGRQVSVETAGGERRVGRAEGVDDEGRLLVNDADTGEVSAYSAGDVTHLNEAS